MKSIELDSQLQRLGNLDIPFQFPIFGEKPVFSLLNPVGGFKVLHSRIYISGPVTGIPELNKPQFMEAQHFLQTIGFSVWNPQHIPEPEIPLDDPEEVWKWYMHFCVRAIPLCDSMLMLPNWQNSKGAVKEHRIAQMLGLAIYYSPVL